MEEGQSLMDTYMSDVEPVYKKAVAYICMFVACICVVVILLSGKYCLLLT